LIIWVNQREKNKVLADYRRIKLAEERRDWRIDVGGWRMEFDSYLLSVISWQLSVICFKLSTLSY